MSVEPDATALRDDDVALFTACYLDPHGGAVGFAIAARRDDRASLDLARRTVADWSAVLRTRQVLVAGTGASEPCTHLSQMHATVDKYIARGDTVIVIGQPGDSLAHGAAASTSAGSAAATIAATTSTPTSTSTLPSPSTMTATSTATTHLLTITNASEVASLLVPDPSRVAFVLQPGMPVEDAAPIIAALRARFGRLPGQHPEQFCYATSDRRAALVSVAQSADLLLVLGAADDPDAARLLGWSGGRPAERYLLDDARRIPRHPLRTAATVAVAPTPSARPGLLDEVVEVLSGLGPMAAARRTVRTDSVSVIRANQAVYSAGYSVGARV